MKMGLFGGTFDPVHHGHLILARDARERLGLERVVFLPSARSPHKGAGPLAAEAVRLAMLQAAVAGEPGLEVDDFELRRPPPSFAIDTVEEMQRRHPGAEWYYLIGADNVGALATWRRYDELRRLVRFVVLARGDAAVGGEFVTLPRRVEISATEIRERVARGESVRYYVPETVWEIMKQHSLYQERAA
jgi:nicotinate-nucleotide adenylyltransferase